MVINGMKKTKGVKLVLWYEKIEDRFSDLKFYAYPICKKYNIESYIIGKYPHTTEKSKIVLVASVPVDCDIQGFITEIKNKFDFLRVK